MKKAANLAHLDVVRASAAGSRFEGTLTTGDLPRVAALFFVDESASEDSGESRERAISLRFNATLLRDEQHVLVCRLEVSGSLPMQCQRCLGDMVGPVHSRRELALVAPDAELRQLPRRYEPVTGNLQRLNLLEAIEDEILLSLPMFPLHAQENCKEELTESVGAGRSLQGAVRKGSAAQDTESDSGKKTKPFAGLEELLKKPQG